MVLLEVAHVHKTIRDLPVLQDISLQLTTGEQLAIMGETGSGKSTLLKIIAGLVQADAGTVHCKGQRVWGPDEKLIPGHPSIAYLSQHFELRNNYRVEELMEYAKQMPGDRFDEIVEICQIGHLLKRRTDQLSGGEKQRIATARLLVGEPEILVLDEPYSNLDMPHRSTMQQVIQDISGRDGITCILVSHEPADILPWADRLLIIKNGQWVQEGAPIQLYHQPADAYVAGLLGEHMQIDTGLAFSTGLLSEAVAEPFVWARPEYFRISASPAGARATLVSVRFAGPQYMLRIHWEGQGLTVHHPDDPKIQPGSEIRISLHLPSRP